MEPQNPTDGGETTFRCVSTQPGVVYVYELLKGEESIRSQLNNGVFTLSSLQLDVDEGSYTCDVQINMGTKSNPSSSVDLSCEFNIIYCY